MTPRDWLKNMLIGLDQLANTVIGGAPDETISSRAWREGWRIVPLIDALFFFELDHCRRAFESERLRRQFPETLRKDVP